MQHDIQEQSCCSFRGYTAFQCFTLYCRHPFHELSFTLVRFLGIDISLNVSREMNYHQISRRFIRKKKHSTPCFFVVFLFTHISYPFIYSYIRILLKFSEFTIVVRFTLQGVTLKLSLILLTPGKNCHSPVREVS